MFLNSNNYGNFTSYKVNDISEFLVSEYNIIPREIKIYNNAMDNTVLEINQRYIMKIYETKTKKFLQKSLKLFNQYKTFYCIELHPNKFNDAISRFASKPVVLYKKAQGQISENFIKNLQLMQDFHTSGYQGKRILNLKKEIQNSQKRIQSYWTSNVKNRLITDNRYKSYHIICDKLRLLKTVTMSYIVKDSWNYGIVHGDCNPQNILICKDKYKFLDFDSIRYNYQLYDLIDLLLKYTDRPDIVLEKKILKKHYQILNKTDDFQKKYDTINTLACYKGFEMALSTEYYCYEMHKFTEIVLHKFFITTLNRLISNVNFRLKEINNERNN